MKKKTALFSSLLALILAVSSFTACGGNDSSGNIILEETPQTIEFAFNSGLSAPQSEYPLSTGKTYYVAANGNDNNDGLSESTPLKTIKKVSRLMNVL